MRRTYNFYMDIPSGFLDFLKTCSDIFALHVEWAFANKSVDKIKAHHSLYREIRNSFPNIPSQIIQTTRDQALEAVKKTEFKTKPKKKFYSAIRYNARTISLRGNLLTFSWTGKRIRTLIKLPTYFEKYKNWKMQAADIGYDKAKHKIKIGLIFEAPDPMPSQEGKKIIGIDRGLYNIVSLSNGNLWSSQVVRKKKRQFLFVKRQLQTKGTKSAKRLLKKRSGKEKRFSLNINHIISKWLANLPYNTYILEDLTGIRRKRRGKKLNGWLSNWAFYQLEKLLEYKALMLGKKIDYVDARYTSQKCSNCGIIDKKSRNKSQYKCNNCGYFDHADINAAKNILNNYILSTPEKSVEQVLINEPHAE